MKNQIKTWIGKIKSKIESLFEKKFVVRSDYTLYDGAVFVARSTFDAAFEALNVLAPTKPIYSQKCNSKRFEVEFQDGTDFEIKKQSIFCKVLRFKRKEMKMFMTAEEADFCLKNLV